ncbi:MAG TPA: spore coat protein U domain-containing protein [Dyella sp.]|uniref:spore coat protein U domain-containing protein n=1 Tax=Dyella sp. TaxID=1869338 RepID=UPI002C499924|nr:spore coat protein U domain-containing protein [Dyella sp.]HTV84216.1 spore coat protein U domain-containing protein [Dyella sp.]
MNRSFIALAGVTTALLSPLCAAATSLATFTVTAQVVASCHVDTIDSPVLPLVVPGDGPVSAPGTVRLRCTKGAVARVVPIQGGTVLTGPEGAHMTYRLQSGAGGPWDVAHPLVGTSTSALVPMDLPFRARLDGGQQAPLGTYRDTVTVEITL